MEKCTKARTHTRWWILRETTRIRFQNRQLTTNTKHTLTHTHTYPSRAHHHSNSLQTAHLFSDVAADSPCEQGLQLYPHLFVSCFEVDVKTSRTSARQFTVQNGVRPQCHCSDDTQRGFIVWNKMFQGRERERERVEILNRLCQTARIVWWTMETAEVRML